MRNHSDTSSRTQSPREEESYLLYASGISYRIGALAILRDIDIHIQPGEVVGLAGSSGAGKSTLLRVLAGQLTPDSGNIFYKAMPYRWPFPAHKFPIGVIFPQPELVEDMDVPSNIFLGNEICWRVFGQRLEFPNRHRMEERAIEILASLDLYLDDIHMPVAYLTGEQRQIISIAKVMVHPQELVLVDDPSLFLNYPYQQILLNLIRTWQEQGAAVLFASDNLDHHFAVADRIVVLQQGRQVVSVPADQTTRVEIVGAMIDAVDRQRHAPAMWALDSYYQARKQAEILRHNQMLLEQDLATQDQLNRLLVDQLSEQVAALDSANIALQDAHRRLLTEREFERKHLARELHDEVIQDLLALNYQLETMLERTSDPEEMTTDLGHVRKEIGLLISGLRRVCRNLRPPTIDSLGLGAALQSYSQEWSDRTGIQVVLELDIPIGRLPESLELSIFRIVQEGLHNIWKHADASTASIVLQHTSPRTLLLIIADNGVGLPDTFDLAELSREGHYGLLGISERVTLMGGRLKFINEDEGGLRIEIEIPHPKIAQSEHFPG